jgi:hypothetical protein
LRVLAERVAVEEEKPKERFRLSRWLPGCRSLLIEERKETLSAHFRSCDLQVIFELNRDQGYAGVAA